MTARAVVWYRDEFFGLWCGYCVANKELTPIKAVGRLARLNAGEAMFEADEHPKGRLFCTRAGCGRNLLDSCAQLPSHWRRRKFAP